MDVLVNTDATNARTAAATDVLDCLLRAATRVAARQSGQLRDLGLSPSAFALLRHLAAADDGLQPCALADLLAVTRPSVCGLIDGLQAKGFVCREPHDHDGRRVIVSTHEDHPHRRRWTRRIGSRLAGGGGRRPRHRARNAAATARRRSQD